METLTEIAAEVVGCTRCPRLVVWREASAAAPPARFQGEPYAMHPLPGFGDPRARLVIVGLAPAAHGGNRTGRIFTGDRSGDFLFAALHRAGYANQPVSVDIDDGLLLRDCFVTAVVRCAPPGNKPLPSERDACVGYLTRELAALPRARAILALGGFAWDGALRALGGVTPKPRFGHGTVAAVAGLSLVGSYHPSQQNTFTGRLTPAMMDEAIAIARAATGSGSRRR